MKPQEWFEFRDVRLRSLNSAVWIPLRAAHKIATGRFRAPDSQEEYFGLGSLAIPVDRRAEAQSLGWTDIGLIRRHQGRVHQGRYIPADNLDEDGLPLGSMPLVLEQDGTTNDPLQWHLHQDFVIALKLRREDDVWVAMREGYTQVARLKRDDSGAPVLLEVRAEQLKDYLCARRMALYVTSYRNREETLKDASHMKWPISPNEVFHDSDAGNKWEGRISEFEHGGISAAVVHVGRSDFDYHADVPKIGPTDPNLLTRSWKVERHGEPLVCIQGELWKDEWVEPADYSTRVRGDSRPSSISFITDEKGTMRHADQLEGDGRWLWFRPEVIASISNRRGGSLFWLTRDTGRAGSSPGSSVHFGVNQLGLVNVYGKDIGQLAEWEQRIWSGFNVSPEGGVSAELLAAQAAGTPSNSQPPEKFLIEAINLLNDLTQRKFGFPLFRDHAALPDILASVHRFRAVDLSGLFSLAKDIARITADGIDAASIQRVAPPPKGEKWGSLKSLQNLLAKHTSAEEAREIVGPLVGAYELRHADAHLPNNVIDAAFDLVKVDRTQPFVIQGRELLHRCVVALYHYCPAISRTDSTGCRSRLNRLRSRTLEVPAKWAFSRKASR